MRGVGRDKEQRRMPGVAMMGRSKLSGRKNWKLGRKWT